MSTEAPPMPKKRPTKKPDPIDGYFLLRLPESYRTLLQAIQANTLRSMTLDTQIALERYAKSLGVEFKPNYPKFLSDGANAGPV